MSLRQYQQLRLYQGLFEGSGSRGSTQELALETCMHERPRKPLRWSTRTLLDTLGIVNAQGADVFSRNNRGHTPYALCTAPEVGIAQIRENKSAQT
eukprot:2007972-Amphidinium_carterae.1